MTGASRFRRFGVIVPGHYVGLMPPPPKRGLFDAIGVLTLVGLVLLALAGWWLFPYLQRSLAFQDCVATGRPNCATDPAKPNGR